MSISFFSTLKDLRDIVQDVLWHNHRLEMVGERLGCERDGRSAAQYVQAMLYVLETEWKHTSECDREFSDLEKKARKLAALVRELESREDRAKLLARAMRAEWQLSKRNEAMDVLARECREAKSLARANLRSAIEDTIGLPGDATTEADA